MNKQGSVKHDGQIKHIELHLNLSAVCGHYYVSNNNGSACLICKYGHYHGSHDYAHALSDTVREKVIHFEPFCTIKRSMHGLHGHTVYVVYYGKV